MSGAYRCGAFALALIFAGGQAAAQDGGTAVPPTPPDLVRLNDGGMVRGTIGELVSDEYVVITMASGETRRFEMSEVAYAGPAAEYRAMTPDSEPQPASGGTTEQAAGDERQETVVDAGSGAIVEGEKYSLSLVASDPDTTFHMETATHVGTTVGGAVAGGKFVPFAAQTGMESYARLCTAPCNVRLMAGSYTFALSRGDDGPVAADALSIEGDARVSGRYIDRSGVRGAGWAIFGVGFTVGTLIAVASETGNDGEEVSAGFVVGATMVLTSTIAGLVMALQGDGAEVVVESVSQ